MKTNKNTIADRCRNLAAKINKTRYLSGSSLLLVAGIAVTLSVLSQNTGNQNDTEKVGLPWTKTITDNQGRSIEATIVTIKDGNVSFRRNGEQQVFTIPINTLSQEDQNFIENEIDPTKINKTGPKILVIANRSSKKETRIQLWGETNAQTTFVNSIPKNQDKTLITKYDGIYFEITSEEHLHFIHAALEHNLPIAIYCNGLAQTGYGLIGEFLQAKNIKIKSIRQRKRGQLIIKENLLVYSTTFIITKGKEEEWFSCEETEKETIHALVRMATK